MVAISVTLSLPFEGQQSRVQANYSSFIVKGLSSFDTMFFKAAGTRPPDCITNESSSAVALCAGRLMERGWFVSTRTSIDEALNVCEHDTHMYPNG